MEIRRVSKLDAITLEGANFALRVTEEAVPPFDVQRLFEVRPVPAYEKSYPRDAGLFDTAETAHRMIATAFIGGSLAGYVAVSRGWNKCAQIDDLMVSRDHRRRGVGQALMDEAIRWAKERGLPMVRLETQSTNVPALRFYERYGFKLGGYDQYLYDALDSDGPHETALFWYLRLM